MTNEFTAVVEKDGEWFIAYCPEIPGANGQGETKNEAIDILAEAISLILQNRREEGLRGVPAEPNGVSAKVAMVTTAFLAASKVSVCSLAFGSDSAFTSASVLGASKQRRPASINPQ